MFVITVEFITRPDAVDAFRAAMVDNARSSREREPGCREFDVCADPEDTTVVFLYEVYDSREAFEAHIASAHFRGFDERVRELIVRKTVRTYTRIDP